MGRMAAIEVSASRLAALQEQIADYATKAVIMLQESKGIADTISQGGEHQ